MTEAAVQQTENTENKEEKTSGTGVEAVAGKRLQSFIDRVQRLEEEKQALSDDIKEVYAEAKAVGFEPDVIKEMVKLAKIDIEKIRGKRETFDLYCCAVGGEFAQLAFSF